MYNVYITRIKNLRPHPNADRLKLGECFGNTVCVSLDYEDNQLGVYFPSDGQVSMEFAEANNLLRKKDKAGNNIGGYMDPVKRNVQAIRLRGEKSDGLFLPLASLESFGDITSLKEGDIVTVFNGKEIACKYIPIRRNVSSAGGGNRVRKKKVNIAPLFMEHADTEQLAYNLNSFRMGDLIEITLKMHGTSQRTGYLPILKGYKANHPWWQRVINTLYGKNLKPNSFSEKLLNRALNCAVPIYDYGYVSGTRRTVLEDYDGGYYGSNAFRETHSKKFECLLYKGETVYYEVVGFTNTGSPIMPSVSNKKLNDKEFIKKYGSETVFSYGCSPYGCADCSEKSFGCFDEAPLVNAPQSDIYVYRMTMTNPDGVVVEYSPDFMRYRCEQMGVKAVPMFTRFILDPTDLEMDTRTAGEIVKDVAEHYYDGIDPIGKTHWREGVVVRIVNRPKFTAYKHKNHTFKVLEGIIKDTADAPDIEEAEEFNKSEEI
jgi:hypothetical protein